MQYRHDSWPGSFRHFCLRDLHLSQLVSVRFRLSRGTLREFVAMVLCAGVGDADVIGAGIIVVADSGQGNKQSGR